MALTEFDFIRRYLQRRRHDDSIVLGIGDDAAVVRPRAGYDLCVSSDMLVKGRHFFADVEPDDLAWKILAVNISDMAAMGAVPKWVLLSAGLPTLSDTWLDAFCGTFFELADRFGITLIGGDTVRGDLVFNVTIAGELPLGRALRRDAAQTGDDIWLSGRVGLAAAALQHRLGNIRLSDETAAECMAVLLRPEPRVALGCALLPFAHAALDVSDGLAQDLGHILKASDVGAEIRIDWLPTLSRLYQELPAEQVRQLMLGGGDDYELVFTAPVAKRQAVLEAGRKSGTAVTRIGSINDTGRLNISDGQGNELKFSQSGFDHFG